MPLAESAAGQHRVTSPEQQLVCCPVSVPCCGGRRWRAPAGGSYIVLRLTYSIYRERGAATGGSQITQAIAPRERCH